MQGSVISQQPWYNLSCQALQPLFQRSNVVRVLLSVDSSPQPDIGPVRIAIEVLEACVTDDTAWTGGCCMKFAGMPHGGVDKLSRLPSAAVPGLMLCIGRGSCIVINVPTHVHERPHCLRNLLLHRPVSVWKAALQRCCMLSPRTGLRGCARDWRTIVTAWCSQCAGLLQHGTRVDMSLFKTALRIPRGGICVSYTVLVQDDSSELALLLPVEPPVGASVSAPVQRLRLPGPLFGIRCSLLEWPSN